MGITRVGLLSAALIGCVTGLGAHQERPATGGKPPDGDSIVVKGCLNGSFLESSELIATDATGRLSGPTTFQLRGEKSLMKQLRKEADGHIVEITGKLKAPPKPAAGHGKQMGKNKVTVSVGTSADPRYALETIEAPPEIVVMSYEDETVSCRR